MSQGEIDWAKVREFQIRAEEYDREQEKRKKLFDPKKLVEDSRRVRTAEDSELGIISYRPLTMDDLAEINKQTSNEEKNIVALHLMLRKTYPDLTEEDVREFGLDAVIRLLKLIVGPAGFLQVQKTLEPGLNQTATFRG